MKGDRIDQLMQEVLDALREMNYEYARLKISGEALEDALEAMTDALRHLRGGEGGAGEAEDILAGALKEIQKGPAR